MPKLEHAPSGLPAGFVVKRAARPARAEPHYRANAANRGDFDLRFPVSHLPRVVVAIAVGGNGVASLYVAFAELRLASLPMALFGLALLLMVVRLWTHPSPEIRRRGDSLQVVQPLALARTVDLGRVVGLAVLVDVHRKLYAVMRDGDRVPLVSMDGDPVVAHAVRSWLEEELGL